MLLPIILLLLLLLMLLLFLPLYDNVLLYCFVFAFVVVIRLI